MFAGRSMFAGRFSALLGVTLWLLGLFVALMLGMLSGYLLATIVFVGSKAYGRLRAVAEERDAERITSGELKPPSRGPPGSVGRGRAGRAE